MPPLINLLVGFDSTERARFLPIFLGSVLFTKPAMSGTVPAWIPLNVSIMTDRGTRH